MRTRSTTSISKGSRVVRDSRDSRGREDKAVNMGNNSRADMAGEADRDTMEEDKAVMETTKGMVTTIKMAEVKYKDGEDTDNKAEATMINSTRDPLKVSPPYHLLF